MFPQIQKNVILGPLTTFKIGGPAKFFAAASTKEEIIDLVKWAGKEKLPIFVLGGGSNILVSDKGFNGLVIKIQNSKFKIQNSKMFSEAGLPLAKLVGEATKNELSGMEWAIGIPGNVGGAVNGNAGAFRKSIADVAEQIEVLDVNNLTVKDFSNAECQFIYRDSVFKRSSNFIILSAVFKLQKSNRDEITKSLREIIKKRNTLQDAGLKCAGCVFKNIRWTRNDVDKDELLKKFPELKQFSDSALPTAFLIDQLGLKGRRIGDAQISHKHANYLINLGAAKAEEVLMLIGLAKERVERKYHILLEEEVQYVGF